MSSPDHDLRDIWRQLLQLLRQQPRVLVLLLCSTVGYVIFDACLPLLSGSAVDIATAGQLDALTSTVCLLAAIAGIRFVLQAVRRFYSAVLAQNLQYDLRQRIAQACLYRNPPTSKQASSAPPPTDLSHGQILSRASSDLTQVQVMVALLPVLSSHVLKILVTLGVLFWIAPVLACYAALVLPTVFWLAARSRHQLIDATQRTQDALGELTAHCSSSIQILPLLHIYRQELHSFRQYRRCALAVFDKAIQASRIQARIKPAAQHLPTAMYVLGMGLAAWLSIQDQISLGEFVAFNAFFISLTATTTIFAGMLVRTQLSLGSLKRVLAIADAPAPPAAPQLVDAVPPAALRLQVSELTLTNAFPPLSFEVAPGTRLNIVGPGSSGKTALLEVLAGVRQPTSGHCTLAASDTYQLSGESVPGNWTQRCALVYEDPFLFHQSIRENLALGRKLDDAALWRALQVAQAADFVAAFPNGLDQEVAAQGINLSGGQRQRLGLARALAGNPHILLLDNATSALDPVTEQQFFHALTNEFPNLLVIATSTRPHTSAHWCTMELPAAQHPSSPEDSLDDAGVTPLPPEHTAAAPGLYTPQAQVEIAPDGTVPTALRLGSLVAFEKWRVLGILLTYSLGLVAPLVLPLLVQRIIDRGISLGDPTILATTVPLGLGLVALSWLAAIASTRLTAQVGETLLYHLRLRAFRQVLRMPNQEAERVPPGKLLTRLTTDIDTLNNFLQTGLSNFLLSLCTLSYIGVFLVATSPLLALYASAGLLVIALATIWFRKFSKGNYRLARIQTSTVQENLHEIVYGSRDIRSTQAQAFFLGHSAAAGAAYRRTRIRIQGGVALYFPGMHAIIELIQAVILGIGGSWVAAGNLAPGVLVAFMLYLQRTLQPIQQLSQVFDSFQQAQVSLERLRALFATPTRALATPNVPSNSGTEASASSVHCQQLYFAYDIEAAASTNTATPWVLRDLTSSFPAHSLTAVVGTTGAGKSTLLKVLAHLYAPSRGEVWTATASGCAAVSTLRTAMVTQEPYFVAGSVLDNIRLSCPTAPREQVLACCDRLGILRYFEKLPQGFDTAVQEMGTNLTASQRQLVNLARAELIYPELLLLDEPTAALDQATAQVVTQATLRLLRGRCAVLVTHRIDLTTAADQVLVLEQGRIIEQGNPSELLHSGGSYARMLQLSQIEKSE